MAEHQCKSCGRGLTLKRLESGWRKDCKHCGYAGYEPDEVVTRKVKFNYNNANLESLTKVGKIMME